MEIDLRVVDESKEKIFKTFNYLHSIPEPPFKEIKTASYLADRLKEAGFEVKTGLAETGLTGTFGSPNAPVLAFRADMDALGHEIDGKPVYIHSCGHDANMTMVLSAAEILSKTCPELKGCFKVVFQPAEEIIQGAKKMVQAGAIDDIAVLIGIHLRPEAETSMGVVTPHLVHSSTNTLIFQVKGEAAHTGRPHQGKNTANALAGMIFAINSIKTNPLKCATINVVSLKAGGPSANVIPEEGELTVNIRAEDNELAASLKAQVDHAVLSVAETFGVTATKITDRGIPASNHDPEAIKLGRAGIVNAIGQEKLEERIVTPGGEDFCCYSILKPELKTAYIGLGSDLKPGLHHPKASFDPEVLVIGTKVLVQIALEYLRNGKKI